MAALPSRGGPAAILTLWRLSQPLGRWTSVLENFASALVGSVAPETEAIAFDGKVCLDLTSATWDAREIDLRLRVRDGEDRRHRPKGCGRADGVGRLAA